MPLTDVAVRNAKADPSRTQRLKDDRGLYLEIAPAGGKWWRLRYWLRGKENRLSLGTYPDVSLKEARERRDEARLMLSRGVDPSEARKGAQRQAAEEALTFEVVAREWYANMRAGWVEASAKHILGRLERHIFPIIGHLPLTTIEAKDVLVAARQLEARGHYESAGRVVQHCGQVFRYAIASGLAAADPTPALRGALQAVPERHHPSITDPQGVGELLRAIEGYQGSPVTACALRLAMLTFVRPGELRKAEWAEFDIAGAEWRIPAPKMKMRVQHLVPLSSQALAFLDELRPITGAGRFVFPSERTVDRCMSENTVNAALRRLGYSKDELTGHGFRSTASTLLNELGWKADAVERQLAHAEGNKIRRAYNYAEYMPTRRRMMQAWANYLDALRDGRRAEGCQPLALGDGNDAPAE